MRIAYGVMGYGRGHAMRTAAVLPSLMEKHEVRVFGGLDAQRALSSQFDVHPIPVIHYHYGESGRISPLRTVLHNLKPGWDAMTAGPLLKDLCDQLRHFKPDLLISDSETFTHRAARRLGIARISFDHVGIMAYCKPIVPAGDWFLAHRDSLGYRAFMGWPERIMISSFFPAIARRPDVEIVPPLMRQIVADAKVSNAGHLLVYLNKGEHQYQSRVERALLQLELPVKIYGTGRQGETSNLLYRDFSEQGFVDDLASARAVLATAGSQLIGESIYLGKPLYLLPEDCFEQRLNAEMLCRMGLGRSGSLDDPDVEDIEEFLVNLPGFRARSVPYRRDGRPLAMQRLNQWIAELTELPGHPQARSNK